MWYYQLESPVITDLDYQMLTCTASNNPEKYSASSRSPIVQQNAKTKLPQNLILNLGLQICFFPNCCWIRVG